APFVAGAFTLLGVAPDPSLPWKTGGAGLFDVTSGANGGCPGYLCNAGPGYDAPTGWGTPNGLLLGATGALLGSDDALHPAAREDGSGSQGCSMAAARAAPESMPLVLVAAAALRARRRRAERSRSDKRGERFLANA